MTLPLEHDYIGLSETPSMGAPEKLSPPAGEDDGLGTELRLGLPGSGSPNRKEKESKDGNKPLLTLGLPKGLVSGAKRGFADAIDGSGKWVFAGGAASEAELGKGSGGQGAGAGNSGKDGASAPKGSAPEKKSEASAGGNDRGVAPAAKAQVVGWPPIRSYRKNTMAANPPKNNDDPEGKQGSGCLYVKVSMDGAPYLRKVDLKMYCNYKELSSALESMFSCFTIGLFSTALHWRFPLLNTIDSRNKSLALSSSCKKKRERAMQGHCGTNGVAGRDGLTESHVMDLVHGSDCVTYEDKDGDWMLVGDVPWTMFTDSCRRLRIMKGSEAIGLAPRAMEKNKNRN